MKKIVIIGNGGHAKEVFTLVKFLSMEKELLGFSIPEKLMSSDTFMGKKLIPISQINSIEHRATVAVGDPLLRRKIVENELPKNLEFVNLIAPQSYIGFENNIGKGIIIMPFCHMTTNIKIGDHSHLYSGTSIGHDSSIGKFFPPGQELVFLAIIKLGRCIFWK